MRGRLVITLCGGSRILSTLPNCENTPMRIISIHAHPDDAEILAGGTLALLGLARPRNHDSDPERRRLRHRAARP